MNIHSSGQVRSRPYPAMSGASARPHPFLKIMFSVLLVFMVAPEGFDYANAGVPTTGSAFSRLVWLIFLGIGLFYVKKHYSFAKQVAISNRFLAVFVILVGLSYLWSLNPGVTLRREIRVLAVALLALACASATMDIRNFQKVLRPVLTALMIGSILFVLTSPQIAVEQLEFSELVGAWKGLATQKNALGSLSAVAALLWLHALLSGQGRQPWPLLGLAVSLVCLINSRSSTSIMATAFAGTLMVMLLNFPKGLRPYMPYLVGAFVCLLLMYSLAMLGLVSGLDFMLKPITAITGKDLTFSNRTSIWDIIIENINVHPWLGGGYGAYWAGNVPTSPSYEMTLRLGFYPTESHNGYIDIINDLGWLGGGCLFAFIIRYVQQALRLFAVDRAQGTLFLILIFEQMIANMSESMWWNARTVEFAIMALATFCLSHAVVVANPPRTSLVKRIAGWRSVRHRR